MRHQSEGCALVLVYENGRIATVMAHEHDGGEAYMGPLIRRAIQYAKVQYESGDITQILLAEMEMKIIATERAVEYLQTVKSEPRHLYYLTVRWDEQAAKKSYRVYVRHLEEGEKLKKEDMPEFADAVNKAKTAVMV